MNELVQQGMPVAVWVAAIGVLGLLIRQIGPWRKQLDSAEAQLRASLIRRVEKLERMLERERTRHNAERALDRHRLNNVTQCFDALLLLIETAPEKAMDAVRRIKEMRATQLLAESEEKAIIRAAEIQAESEEAAEALRTEEDAED